MAAFARIWTQDLPDLPLFFSSDVTTYRKGVTNLIPRVDLGDGNSRMWNSWEWDRTE